MGYESWTGRTWWIDSSEGDTGLSASTELRFVEEEGGEKKVEILSGTCWATACLYVNTMTPDTLEGTNWAGRPFKITRTILDSGAALSCIVGSANGSCVPESLIVQESCTEDPGGSWTAHEGGSGTSGGNADPIEEESVA